jgi:uncharacterized protein involved in type VI secretion and phage assembly
MSAELAHLLAGAAAAAPLPLGYSVVVARVVNNKDTEGLGRVKVKFEWLSDLNESAWARIAAPMAGNDRGAYFLPEIDDEVLVAFAHGDVRFPYVIGSLWNGVDKPPADNADGANNVRIIKSRSGHVIRLDDTDGKEQIEIADGTGRNQIVIDTATNTVRITSAGDIQLSAPDGTIKLSAKSIDLGASDDALMTASGPINIASDDDIKLDGRTINLN